MVMQWICDHFYLLILLLAFSHLCGFAWLWRERRRQARWLAEHLANLVQGFSSHADRDAYATVDEQIDSFLANIREVLDDPARGGDRQVLHQQIITKDETKKYLRGSVFETLYSLARTSIEIYPLLGIMGTVLAIALALNSPGGTAAGDAGMATERIVRNFAGSIWATLAGIGCGIILLLINSVVEPGVQRLLEHRWDVRETISAVKTQLGTKPS
jgi:biopolymer transport protein ExbB/TolQ